MADPVDLEVQLARHLRAVLRGLCVGDSAPDSEDLRLLLSALEFYLPAVLRAVHATWKHESLDGLFSELARMSDERELEIAGNCILISDQTVTPYHVRLCLAPLADEIEALDCKLGELRHGKLVQIPYSEDAAFGRSVADRLTKIAWKYHVGFGN